MTVWKTQIVVNKLFSKSIAISMWRHITGRVQIQQYEHSMNWRLNAIKNLAWIIGPLIEGSRSFLASRSRWLWTDWRFPQRSKRAEIFRKRRRYWIIISAHDEEGKHQNTNQHDRCETPSSSHRTHRYQLPYHIILLIFHWTDHFTVFVRSYRYETAAKLYSNKNKTAAVVCACLWFVRTPKQNQKRQKTARFNQNV